MSNKFFRLSRVAAAGSMAAALAFTLSACSDDGGGDDKGKTSASGEQGGDSGDEEQDKDTQQTDNSKVITTLKGAQGIEFDVTSAVRDASGFVTVNGVLKNTSDSEFNNTSAWNGGDLKLQEADGGGSLGGATLVDKKDNKRYFTLRDTEDAPLTTTGIVDMSPGEKLRVFIQFPAPPEKSNEVDLQIPTFQSASLVLKDG